MQIFECKMSCNNVGIRVIRGVLYRAEIVNLILLRHNDYTSGVLTCRAFNADAVCHYAIDLCTRQTYPLFFKIFHNITVCGLIGKRAYGTRTENVFRTEKFFGILMYLSLHFTRKVKVNIGRFITVKTKKRFKWYMMSVRFQLLPAARAVFVRQVKSGACFVGIGKVTILTIRAPIMRRQWIYLRDTRHRCDK